MANYPQTTTTQFTGNIDLTDGGLVGIGTTSPSTKIHVRASDASGAYGGSIVSGTIGLVDATGSGSPARLTILKGDGAEILNFGGSSSSDEAGIQYDPTTHKMAFKTNSTDNQVIIDGYGQVGIGTTPSGVKLQVNGNIKTSMLMLGSNAVQIKTGSGAPDNNDGAPIGSLYLRTTSGSPNLYVKTGTTTWTAK
jgi:hypothetical protein